MITAADIVQELMEQQGFVYLNEELGLKLGRGLTYAYMHEFERYPDGFGRVGDNILVSPGGVIVKKFEISNCGMKVGWRHRDQDYEVHLAEPDSIDKILSYVKSTD